MAQWRKVIVSGSAAELSSLTLDTALPVAQGGIGATSLTDKAVLISQDSGTDVVGYLKHLHQTENHHWWYKWTNRFATTIWYI